MTQNLLEQLRAKEGSVVQLTSTEGEVLSARVLHVFEEEQDVAIDVLSTNQPESYERLGKSHKDGSWVIPLASIVRIDVGV